MAWFLSWWKFVPKQYHFTPFCQAIPDGKGVFGTAGLLQPGMLPMNCVLV